MMILLPSPAAVPSSLLSAFLLVSLLFFFSSSTFVYAGHDDDCAPSSCGNLTNIRYPFRLKDDPPHCGDSNYELTCDHDLNRTILTPLSNSYYVTNITYSEADYDGYPVNYVGFEIQVMYVGMEKSNNNIGSCHLPLPLPCLPVSKLTSNSRYYWTDGLWATWVNCSKEVNMSYDSTPVPCLSHNNSFFIYLTLSQGTVGDLMPSCRYLAMFPYNFNIKWDWSGQHPVDILKVLAQGFILHGSISQPPTIPYCLRQSLRQTYKDIMDKKSSIREQIGSIALGVESNFLGCLQFYDHNRKDYYLLTSMACIIVIYIVASCKSIDSVCIVGKVYFCAIDYIRLSFL